jgi:hypothetical protein
MEYTLTKNAEFGSLEIMFNGKPCAAIRDALKALRFRWHGVRRVWYGYADEQTTRAALDGVNVGGTGSAANVQNSEQNSQPEEQPERVSSLPSIRFYYNGIKVNGGELIKCHFSADENGATIYASGYGAELPRELFDVRNDTDIMTDYFDKDSATLPADHPLYKYAFYMVKKEEYKQHARTLERQKKNPRLYSYLTAEQRAAKMREFEQLTDPGQPTNADLIKIEDLNAAREQARKEAEEAAERERVATVERKKASGAQTIREGLQLFPLDEQNGGDFVMIEWSEHPAFYEYEERGGLKLSIMAADWILGKLDAEQHEKRETEDGRGWYDKTSFRIYKGGECVYSGRYDLGDNDGGLIEHISANAANRELDEDERGVIEWIRAQAGITSPLPTPVHVATIAEQITAADLQSGDEITMIYLDPWIMTATTTAATVNSASACEYAQHKDAARIEYTPKGKRKARTVHISGRDACVIYRGILPDVPNSIKFSDCGSSSMLQRVNYAGENAREYMRRAVEYYKSIGFVPVFDTVSDPEQNEPVESLDDSSVEYIAYYS